MNYVVALLMPVLLLLIAKVEVCLNFEMVNANCRNSILSKVIIQSKLIPDIAKRMEDLYLSFHRACNPISYAANSIDFCEAIILLCSEFLWGLA
jgi:hypothetical protein